MKSYLIILGLFLLIANESFAYEKVYLQQPGPYSSLRRIMYRPTINPYNAYYSPYRYRRTNYYNPQRIQRLNRIRRMNNRIRYYSNFLSQNHNLLSWNKNKNNSGVLTGYSTPISPDVYQKMGITPYNSDIKQVPKSTTCDTDLFSMPSGDEMYYRNGELRKNIGGTSGKTGVTIIYD